MASPYWRYPGILNGRIDPQVLTAPDGSYVFCLGGDSSNLQEFPLEPGDVISVEQTIDVTGIELIKFYFQIRLGVMPAYRSVVSADAIEVKNGGLIITGPPPDALIGIIINSPTLLASRALFINKDGDQLIKLSGFAQPANNLTCRVTAIPIHEFISPAGRVAIIENAAAVNEVAAGATAEMLGARWVGKAYIGISNRLDVVEFTDLGPQRDLAINVSKLNGFHDIKYVLELESVTS